MSNILEVRNLKTSFFTRNGEVEAVRDISFCVEAGKIIGIIGESGCGKSVTALSILGLLSKGGKIKSGEIIFKGKDIRKYTEKEMLKIRGEQIAMVFQNSMTSLNPLYTIENQMIEILRYHKHIGKQQAREQSLKMLKSVGIPFPEERLKSYPHELSGGMRQRVAIGMALSCEPELLLADEPTTALDVTLQIQILDLIQEMAQSLHTAVLLITHDLGVVANICERVIVMYAGKIMEEGTVDEIFENPLHPYTQGLLKTVQDLYENRSSDLFCIEGLPPQLLHPPKGCPFAARCPFAMQICMEKEPERYVVSCGDDPKRRTFTTCPNEYVGNIHKASCWLLDKDCPKGD